jgi:hypothetical protein
MRIQKLAYCLAASLSTFATMSVAQFANASTNQVAIPANTSSNQVAQTPSLPTDQVYIKDFTYAGSGCPANSVGSLLSDDRSVLEVLFDRLQVNLQPTGQAAFPQQSNCALSIKLHIPAGWSATWHRVEHRGFADTSGKATGELRARYYIPGAGGFDANRVFNFKPNYVRDYTIIHDNISTAYTACGREVPMTVNTRIRLSGRPTGYNALTVDSISKKVKTTLFLKYKRCSR